ncbi:hypothetical protein HanIR_Chr13g0663651 [Helianthus annuus]|nr:hypothetical protein HanIR_Chr13g0663651 [Helianthus annuus]
MNRVLKLNTDPHQPATMPPRVSNNRYICFSKVCKTTCNCFTTVPWCDGVSHTATGGVSGLTTWRWVVWWGRVSVMASFYYFFSFFPLSYIYICKPHNWHKYTSLPTIFSTSLTQIH